MLVKQWYQRRVRDPSEAYLIQQLQHLQSLQPMQQLPLLYQHQLQHMTQESLLSQQESMYCQQHESLLCQQESSPVSNTNDQYQQCTQDVLQQPRQTSLSVESKSHLSTHIKQENQSQTHSHKLKQKSHSLKIIKKEKTSDVKFCDEMLNLHTTHTNTDDMSSTSTLSRVKKNKRKTDDSLDEASDTDTHSTSSTRSDQLAPPAPTDDLDDPTGGFKLPASKSPIMESLVVCALHGWGIELLKNESGSDTTPPEVVFQVNDFNRYYNISRKICSKQRPTDDVGSRVKSLRRWFVHFPKKKDRNDTRTPFTLVVKPNIASKVNEIILRNAKETLGLTKRRRRQ
eukprot:TRINITY_DN841_c0_g1_i3.p1 TRINITY_DN841_c0_g1~~TRINITY_DN841_c0_g1_i3.p1  ORF type:complete len:342 (+),score=86.88 TRINITY_DN841_c0_g1_i3:925-1950(+)